MKKTIIYESDELREISPGHFTVAIMCIIIYCAAVVTLLIYFCKWFGFWVLITIALYGLLYLAARAWVDFMDRKFNFKK